MARRRAPAGQRQRVIAHAWLSYHGGKITWSELTRCLQTFRQ